MSSSRTLRKARKTPPLVTTETTEIASDGTPVRVTQFRRGVLMSETRKYSSIRGWAKEVSEPPRAILERYCERLRDQLEESGLPSDRTPKWIRKPGGDWEPHEKTDEPPIPYAAHAVWTSRIDKLTEPLTNERAAANLLSDLNEVLELQGIDEHLWHIGQLMESYAAFRMVGPVNSAAAAGLAAEKARAAGPAKKQERAQQVRALIRERALSAWSRRPILRGDASNTAACILSEVNESLRAHGLLRPGKDGLSAKTIADHISASREEK
jgi:hypothetical protein